MRLAALLNVASAILTVTFMSGPAYASTSLPSSSITSYGIAFSDPNTNQVDPNILGFVQYQDETISTSVLGPYLKEVPSNGAPVTASGVGGSASATISYALSPIPGLTTTASVSINGADNGYSGYNNGYPQSATGTVVSPGLKYYFEVLGPSGPVTINAIASGFVKFSGSSVDENGSLSGEAFWSIEQVNQNSSVYADGVSTGTGEHVSFSDNVNIDLQTATLYEVDLDEGINLEKCQNCYSGTTGLYGSYTESGTASIDPTFAIAGPNSSQYSFLFSQGVGNGAVPEPSSWAMLLAGFGLIGGTMRGRRYMDLHAGG